jgi:hypothetical protein
VGGSANFFNTLSGSITLNGFQINLRNPLPYTDACNSCPIASYFVDSNSVYSILGNKLYLAVLVDKPAQSQTLRYVDYFLTLRIVEVKSDATGLGLDTASVLPY